MESRIARELQMKFEPVAVIFTDELPPDALQFKEGKWGCVIAMLTAAAKGRITAFSRETCGCGGGRVGLGFGGFLEGMQGGIEYFLSTGREGHLEGEGYKKTPEIAKSFVDQLPVMDIPYTYVVFKPLSLADPEKETLQLVIFYVNADQLTALVVLANYDDPNSSSVFIPQASGCQSVCLIPFNESQRERPRAVVGLMDVSARPYVDLGILAFTVPYRMFLEMEANVPGSFFEKEAWSKVKKRL